jgi:hypothetical protein
MDFGGFLGDLVGETQTKLKEVLGQKIEKELNRISGDKPADRTSTNVVHPDIPSEVARAANQSVNGVFSQKIAGIPLWVGLLGLGVVTYLLVRRK